MLKQKSKEVVHIANQPYYSNEFVLWRRNVEDILESAFGVTSREYKRVADIQFEAIRGSRTELQRAYVRRVHRFQQEVDSIIQKHELLGIEEKPAATVKVEIPKAFIAHGGETEARSKLQKYLIALGVQPLIIEEESIEGRSVNEQVEYYLEQADCAIILGTADDKELKDGKLYPRRNVYIEIGRFQERFSKRIIYLLEEDASFPSDISEKLYTRFTQDNMEKAFLRIVIELKAFDILKAVKP